MRVALKEQDSIVRKVALDLIRQAVVYLPDDVKAALQKAYAEESSEIGRIQLKVILGNVALAEKRQVPICQDTGTMTFYVKAGATAKSLDKIDKALTDATRQATAEIPLRPNAVDPLKQKNSGDNTGCQTLQSAGKSSPAIAWKFQFWRRVAFPKT